MDLKSRKLTPSFDDCSLGGHPGGLPTVCQSLTPSLEWVLIASAFPLFVIKVFKKEKSG